MRHERILNRTAGLAAVIVMGSATSPLRVWAQTPGGAAADAPAAPVEAWPGDWRVAWQLDGGVGSWLFLLGMFLGGWLLGKVAETVLRRVASRWSDHGWTTWSRLLDDLAGPLSLAVTTVGLAIGLAAVEMSSELRLLFDKLVLVLFSLAALWYGYSLTALVDVALRLADRTNSALDQQMGPIVRKLLRLLLLVGWVMFILSTVLERDIGAWLAGLGLAGLAFSLAAQDSLKNLFGSLTILLDRPYRLGERIIVGSHDGTIEEIGFRSTKVRTPAGNLVTIPNSSMVSDAIENVGRRPYIRRNFNLTLTYDTPRAKVIEAVELVSAILEEPGIAETIHPEVSGQLLPPRVFFNDFNADSLNVAVFYWYAPPNFWEYLEHSQRVNLRIFEEFERAGIEFAFPTQTLYLAGDPNRKLVVEGGPVGSG